MERIIGYKEIFDMREKNHREILFANKVNNELKKYGYFKSAHNDNERMLYEMLYSYGQLIQYPYGCVAKQMQLSFYCRGERARYGSSKASLHRVVPQNKGERFIYYLIENMKLAEFYRFLNKLDVVKKWRLSSVNYDALAQHYGLKTDYIDITNNFDIALFFACCKYDETQKSWRPLSKSDIQWQGKSTIDYRYGVIYKGKALSKDFLYGLGNTNPYNPVLPVGFQPLMRCQLQHAYTMQMNEDDDLYQDPRFEILIFEHSPELSNRIFNDMKQGQYIYPRYEIDLLDDQICKIKDQKIFSKEVLENVYSWLFTFPYLKEYDSISIDTAKEMLRENGIEIISNYCAIDEKEISMINTKCSEQMWI